jgi:transposase
VAIERAEGLLVEHLQALGLGVYPVSPRVAARIRERYRVAPIKDDAFDAFTLADALRHEQGRWRPLGKPSPLLAELRALTRDRERIVAEHMRISNQLHAILESYHPAATRLFSSLDRKTSLAFIRTYPTAEQAATLGERRMARFLARHGYTGRVPAATLSERLRANLLTAAPGTVAGKSFTARAHADLLELLTHTRDAYDRRIAELLSEHPDAAIFLSFPGVAVILAATLLAEIGEDRERFPEAAMLLAEAGLAPVTRQSGKTRRVRFRYAASHRLRQAFTWWAFNSLKESPWAKELYERKRAGGQRQYRALRGVAACWGRVLYRCWQDGRPYEAERHPAARALIGS